MPETTLRQIERSQRFFSPAVVFFLCAILSFSAWYIAFRASTSENLARFDRSATSLTFALKNRMDVYTNALVYTRNLFDLKPHLTSQEFTQFVQGMDLEDQFPGIQNIGYIKHYSQAELKRSIDKMPPKARELLQRPKDSYDVVLYVENMVDMPTTALGMDLSASLERNEAMRQAEETGRPVATARVTRISAPKSEPVEPFFLVFVPHYKAGVPLETPEQRKAALVGFIYGGFRSAVLFGNIAGDAKMQDTRLVLQVYDGSKIDPENLIYSKGNVKDIARDFYKEISFRAAEHDWKVVLGAISSFSPAYSRFLPLLLLLVGSVLTFGMTYSARKSQLYAAKLHEDILIRRQAEAQLREEKRIVELTSKIGTTLKAEQDLESIVQSVTDVATDLTHAKFGAFFYNTYNTEGEILTLFSLSGADKEDFAKFGMPRNTEVFKPTFEGTGITRVDDITKDPHYGKMAPHFGMPKGHLQVKSYLSAPVISKNGDVLGGLFFGHPDPGIFTPRAEAIVRSLAIQAASAMDNANLYRELSQARTAADAANRAKSLFLANVSHEIRTPLGVMMGFAELTAENKSDPHAVEENVQKIIRNGRELTRIIGEVLDLSKIEANALLVENSTFPLGKFLDELQSDWQPQIEAKNIRFEMVKIGQLPTEVCTDSTRLTQIIVNLLSNALKFTERGFIRLTVDSQGENLTVKVEDSGLGISDTHKTQLFRTFSQGDSSITRRYGGSGLGLALSKQLAKALGGDLVLMESRLGQGSTFVLTLPTRLPELDKASVAAAPPRKSSPGTTLEGVRILLVEDSIDNQILINTLLQKVGASIENANNGEEGVQKALANTYDIVLMDIQMPLLDGYAAFEKLKAAGYSKPIVALTAHALIQEKEKAYRMGFFGYLTKPLNRQALISTIADACR